LYLTFLQAVRQVPNVGEITLEENSASLETMAEEELQKAADVIKECAKVLESAKPARTTPKVKGVLDEFDIKEAIITSASAIAGATGTLVQSAALAQTERVSKAKHHMGSAKYRADPTWANGKHSVP
jgi:hypothetical protein